MFVEFSNKGSRRVGLRAVVGFMAPALLLLVSLAHAGSDERKGTGGAHELRIPVGPRGTALGGAVVADAQGTEALFWNPAGIASMTGTEAMFSNTQYFADMQLNWVGLAARLGGFGSLGVSVKALSVGEIIVTTEAAPEGTGDIIDPTFTVFGITYAREFTDRVRFGGTISFVNESIRNARASGLAFDFGVIYETGWNSLNLGMAMKNFGGAMRFEGEDFETNLLPPDADPSSSNRTFRSTSSEFEMPSYFTLSATYDLMADSRQSVRALGAFQNNNFVGDNLCAGLEWAYRDQFALRGSYVGSITSKFDAVTGNESIGFDSGDDLYAGFALGAMAAVRAGESEVEVDVSWRPTKNDLFDDVLEFGVKVHF